MDKLAKVFWSKSLANKLFLKKVLFKIKLEENGDLMQHFNKCNFLSTQLARLVETFKSECMLYKEFKIVRTSLLVGKTILDFDLTMVILEADKLTGPG